MENVGELMNYSYLLNSYILSNVNLDVYYLIYDSLDPLYIIL
jgi:hypothetical protein